METKTDKSPHDPDSFDHQIQRPELRARLINLARRKGVPATDCEDVASDIVAEAIRCQGRYDRKRGSVSTWTIALGENVIRNYVRGLNAQKRKPEGGIISSDAASDLHSNSLQVTDNRAEEQRRSSQDVEHFLDTADLSEKETKAIAVHRDKEANEISTKFSSSTARRAMEKIKQAASDEKFQERPRGPEACECAYGKIPRAERSAALLYDQLRRIPWFVNAINSWRKSPAWKDTQAYLQSEAALKRFPLIILGDHWPEHLQRYRDAAHERDPFIRRRFEAAVDIAVAFTEWPTVGYCRLVPDERRQRLEQFGWTFGAEPFWEITDRSFDVFVGAADKIPQPGTSLTVFLESIRGMIEIGSEHNLSLHLVAIDRRHPRKTVVGSFDKWFAGGPKRASEKIRRSGRPRTTNLIGFACIRLVDDFGLSMREAASWLKERYGGPIPITPERLGRAVQSTRNALKSLLPSPAEIGA
jgi:DNA-directed RNA polymerase specialized sigma24 family protein